MLLALISYARGPTEYIKITRSDSFLLALLVIKCFLMQLIKNGLNSIMLYYKYKKLNITMACIFV